MKTPYLNAEAIRWGCLAFDRVVRLRAFQIAKRHGRFRTDEIDLYQAACELLVNAYGVVIAEALTAPTGQEGT